MTEATLVRGAGAALWRQIAGSLEAQIESGATGPGERLPTEQQLAARFGVNRHTVRRAIAALAELGLVRVEQGRGVFVRDKVTDYRLRPRTLFSENILEARQVPSGRLIRLYEQPATENLASALGVPPEAPLWVIERVGEADGRPITLANHRFAKSRFPTLDQLYPSLGSITATLAALGVTDYRRRVTRVSTRMPRAAEALLLEQPVSKPVLVTWSLNVDMDNRPLEVTTALWAADRVQFLFEPES